MPYNPEYQRKWRKEHPGRCTESVKKHYWKRKHLVFDKFGNKCANPACQWLNSDGTRGCTDMRCLQIDHVNDDGYVDQENRKPITFLRLVLEDTLGRYQLLCANCNWIKRGIKNGYNNG